MKKNIIAGLDLGTTKVCAVIAERLDDNKIDILGFGVAPSEGLHKGLVANIGKTAKQLKKQLQLPQTGQGLRLILLMLV